MIATFACVLACGIALAGLSLMTTVSYEVGRGGNQLDPDENRLRMAIGFVGAMMALCGMSLMKAWD